MDQQVFESIRRIVHDRSGISLGDGKARMVAARIARRLRELGLDSDRAYLDYLQDNVDETVNLLNVISTNVTRFFREPIHFEFLKATVTGWLEGGQDRLRIWSAASSTGQEPWSICMTVDEAIRQTGSRCDFKLLGTDISTRVLDRAAAASYTDDEVDTIPKQKRMNYFTSSVVDGQKQFTVKDSLKQRAVFKRLNLNEPPFPMKGPLDIVFCCNVMIYFDATTKRRLLTEIHRLLRPDGFLIVSQTESLTGLTDLYAPVRPSIYAKANVGSEALAAR